MKYLFEVVCLFVKYLFEVVCLFTYCKVFLYLVNFLPFHKLPSLGSFFFFFFSPCQISQFLTTLINYFDFIYSYSVFFK